VQTKELQSASLGQETRSLANTTELEVVATAVIVDIAKSREAMRFFNIIVAHLHEDNLPKEWILRSGRQKCLCT
jgi:hypothetical protein